MNATSKITPFALAILALLAISFGAIAAAPYGRYTIGTDTVVDLETQLTWQRVPPASTYTASGASAYCQSLSLGGVSSGWRLPSVRELQTLTDETLFEPAIDSTAFPPAGGTAFWTSTPWNETPTNIFYVDFYDGSSNWASPSTDNYVRCVH